MFRSIVFCLIFILPSQLAAQVFPEKAFYRFDPQKPPVVNVDVINSHPTRTMRVETTSIKVNAPGEKDEQSTSEGALLVSPKSFSLAPNSRRTVRLLLKAKPTTTEDVYRVAFEPKSFSEEVAAIVNSNEAKKTTPQLAVLIGGGILVFAPPQNAKKELSWEKTSEGLLLTNTGDVNLLLSATESCQLGGTKCEGTDQGKRLYAGKSMTLKGGPVFHLEWEPVETPMQKFTIETSRGKKEFSE
ncbi:fimbria/pilus periplasmic chaperone [bacterium]|nr:fimbria/pilus periplasmic chaperone [bacterium]